MNMRDNDSNGIGKKIVVILLVLLLLLGAAGGVYFFLFNKEQPYQSTFKVGISSTGASVSVTATYQLEGEETSTPLLSNSKQSSISFSGASGEKYFEAGKDIVLNSDNTFVVFTFCIKNDQQTNEETNFVYIDVSFANNMSHDGLTYYYSSLNTSQNWDLQLKHDMIKMYSGWTETNLAPQESIFVNVLVELDDLDSEVKITSSLDNGLSINLIGTDRFLQGDWFLNSQNVALSYVGTDTDIVVPDNVVGVSTEIFKDNTDITSVVFPSSVKRIGASAFENCTELTSVTFLNNSTSTSVGDHISNTTQSTLGGEDDAVIIGDRAFKGCVKLTSIILPDNLDGISDAMLMGCSSLTEIDLPSAVSSISNSAFSDCVGLESINIPASVTSIEENAFKNCSNLENVVFEDFSAEISTGVLDNCDSLTEVVVNVGDGKFVFDSYF